MARSWKVAAATVLLLVTVRVQNVLAAGNGDDPYAIPKGGPAEVAAFLQTLMQKQPASADDAAKINQAAEKAADKILSGKANEKQLALAAEVKSSLTQDQKALEALEDKLTSAGHKAPARTVHDRLLTLRLQQVANDPGKFRKQLDDLKVYLREGPLQAGDGKLAMSAGQIAEQSGNSKLAGETYESLAAILAARPETAGMAKQMQAFARRLNLVGNYMQLEGKQLDNTPLDWSKYRGKVVLVDFWATWCGPCMAEVPNIKSNYEKYHKKGFEVVGISLDTQLGREELADFVKKEEVKWTICRDADSTNRMADFYGVQSIPTMILVGRDGKVINLNARGDTLGPLVEKALAAAGGPVAADDTVADDSSDKKKKPGRDRTKVAKNAKTKVPSEEAIAAKEKRDEAAKADALAARERREEAAKARAPKPRQWADSSGRFHAQATFRGMAHQVVKLELEDGRMIEVPLEKLCDDDQTYIQQRAQAQ